MVVIILDMETVVITLEMEMVVTTLEMVVTIRVMVDTTTVETIKEMEASILENNLKHYSINLYLFQYFAHTLKLLTLQGLKIAVVCRTLNKL